MKLYLNSDPGAGIYIISDCQEDVFEFFKHHRLMSGFLPSQLLASGSRLNWDKVLRTSQTSQVVQENCFTDYPSYNDDGKGGVVSYGSFFNLAPVSSDVIQFWDNRPQPKIYPQGVFLERDPQDSKLYYFVGWSEKVYRFQPGSFYQGK